MDEEGMLKIPTTPGLGLELDLDAVKKYLVDVEIRVGGRVLYATPKL